LDRDGFQGRCGVEPPGGRESASPKKVTLISDQSIDIVLTMKQLLLRMPDEVHRRLAARAARDGRSVNSVATEILDAAADADEGDRRARLRARAATLGILRATSTEQVSRNRRRRVIASTKGIEPILDQLLAEDRGRV
ncbi:MAG: Arc family DNA-binding protein, partial [Actinobacteria bacterium]|nr:Arc family DNA-binding protein [Actinomycetota bacterium]